MTRRKFKKALRRIINLPTGINLFRYINNKFKLYFYKFSNSNKAAYPSSIMIELTNQCNLKCITCPREYDFGFKMDKGYISLDNLKKVIDEIYPYVDSIGLTGLGETFLHKNIVEIVDYIRSKSKGIIITCSINAHLKNSVEIAEKLKNKIGTIQISIDGIGEVYNSVRKNADYNFFLDNVKQIVALTNNTDTDVMFNMVVIKENYFQMSDMVTLCNELGIKYFNIIPMNIIAQPSMDISYYDFYKTKDFVTELKKAYKTAKNYPDIEFTTFEFDKKSGFRNCRFIDNYYYITWDGYIPQCCAMPFPKEFNYGNVFKDGLLKCINSQNFKETRKLWIENKTPNYCKKCFVVDFNSE